MPRQHSTARTTAWPSVRRTGSRWRCNWLFRWRPSARTDRRWARYGGARMAYLAGRAFLIGPPAAESAARRLGPPFRLLSTFPGILASAAGPRRSTRPDCVDCRAMSDLQNTPGLLEAMAAAALEAGRVAHEIYLGHFEVQRKADQSPVTAADHAAEAIILERLRVAAPGVPVVAEEEVAAGRVPVIGNEFYLVDPLDGTKEFVQRNGDFTVNIALVRAGDPVLGVVYAPVTAALYLG